MAASLRERLDGSERTSAEKTRSSSRTVAALTAERDQARAELQRLRDRVFGVEGAAREAQEKQRAAESRLALLEETAGLGAVRQLLGELDPARRAVLEKGIARLLHWGRRR